jgi:hypothetical protein
LVLAGFYYSNNVNYRNKKNCFQFFSRRLAKAFEPIKPTDGFKMTTSGKVDKRNDVRLSFLTKEFSNVPSSKIDDRRAGMPPAMYTPPLANAFKPKFAASVP